MDSSLSPTEKYLSENQYVNSLPRRILDVRHPYEPLAFSVGKLISKRLHSTILCMVNYPRQLWVGRASLLASFKLGKKSSGKRCIVIGNGPSQGFLDASTLNTFVDNGGETICVNHWNLNKEMSDHIPTWLVISDPASLQLEDRGLGAYLFAHPTIKILAPPFILRSLSHLSLGNEIFSFIDVELPFLGNINPFLPRGYVSLTLYKGLAWALFLGYSQIGIIGMDNTYPRNIFCDSRNRVLNLECHAGTEDYVCDHSSMYPSVDYALEAILVLFRDLRLFPDKNIVNIDPYSLTDRFPKTTPARFFLMGNGHE